MTIRLATYDDIPAIIYLLSGDERLAYQKTISLQDQLFALQDKAYAE